MSAPVHQMLTANRLVSGDVVYWRAGGWVEGFADAELLETEAAAQTALDAARKFVASNAVVNPYLFEVRAHTGGIHPVKEREVIRAAGPTVRADLGKQAQGLAPAPSVHPADAVLAAKVKKADDVSI